MDAAPPFLTWRAIYAIVLGALAVEIAAGIALVVVALDERARLDRPVRRRWARSSATACGGRAAPTDAAALPARRLPRSLADHRPRRDGDAGLAPSPSCRCRARPTRTACASCSSTSGCRSRWWCCRSRSSRASTGCASTPRTSCLETRFDLKTRQLAAFLFLLQRGLSAGITIYAPAIVLSTRARLVAERDVVVIGGLVILYTVAGGTRAVSQTQKHQMVVMLGGHGGRVRRDRPPAAARRSRSADAVRVAGTLGKMNVVDFSPGLGNRYTLWSGLAGGLLPGDVVLRHRPVAGAALPVGALGDGEPPRPAVQRPAQGPDAGADPVRRRDGVRLLPVQPAAAVLQRGRAARAYDDAARRRAARARGRASRPRSRRKRAEVTAPDVRRCDGRRRGARSRRPQARVRAAAADSAARARPRRARSSRRRCPAPRAATPTTSSCRS